MAPLTDRQISSLCTGAVLLATCAHAVTNAAAETIADAGALFIAHGRAAPVPAQDWPVIERAAADMAAASLAQPPVPGPRPIGSIADTLAAFVRRFRRPEEVRA